MTSPASDPERPVPTAARTRAARGGPLLSLLGWAGFTLLVLYAILGGGWIGVYSVAVRTLSLVAIAVGLVVWFVIAWRRPEWRPSTAIWPAFAAPLLAFVLSTAASPFPRLGLDYVSWTVLLSALYLLLVRILATPFARARIGALAAMLALVLGAIYVGLAANLWVEWWALVGEVRIPPLRPMYLSMPWGGPSAVLTVQVLLAAAAAAGLGFSTRASRMVVAVVIVLTALVALISGSRSGWLALGGAIVMVGGLWLLDPSRRASIAVAFRDRRVTAAVVVVGAIVAVAAVAFGPTVLGRFLEGGDGGRPTYWATALCMFADAPILGLGPGHWAARRIAYTEAGELDFYIPHAHNQVLETAAEFGVVGLVAGAIALACVAWLSLRALRGSDPTRRRWAWATVFGMLYLAIATVVDSYTYPAVLLPLALPVAYLDATSDRSLGLPSGLRGAAASLRRLAVVALVIGCAAAVVFLAHGESVALTHARAVMAANKADWQGALEPAFAAATAEPDLPPYQVTAGLAAAGTGDWEGAEVAFRTGADLDDLPASWLGLALAQLELGRPTGEVEESLGRAMRIGEQQPAITFAVGQVYERLGMPEAADTAYAMTMSSIPSLASDGRWAGTLGSPGRFEAIVERAIEAAPGAAWEIALMAGDAERARSLVSTRADSAFWQAIIDAWSGDVAALRALQAIADDDPMNATALAWAARVSERAGDRETARDYRRLVDIGLRGASQGVEVRVGDRVPWRDAALGTRTFYYGNYMYRRTTPIDLIVPGLPGLVIDGIEPEVDPQ